MKDTIKSILRQIPGAYPLAKNLRARLAPHISIPLSTNQLPEARYESVCQCPDNNEVIEDLLAYTGFSEQQVRERLRRSPRTHFESEFRWYSPKDRAELLWFYRCSSGYLWANAIHPYSKVLDVITKGRVLDYGAGIGCNTLGLARRGLEVDFLEIGMPQAEFLNFRVMRRGLTNVTEIKPYYNGAFDPLKAITRSYDVIVAMDVLEHIPDYHVVVKYFISHLNPGGLIIENSPFDAHAEEETAIHLKASVPMATAMQGMESMGNGLWRKPAL